MRPGDERLTATRETVTIAQVLRRKTHTCIIIRHITSCCASCWMDSEVFTFSFVGVVQRAHGNARCRVRNIRLASQWRCHEADCTVFVLMCPLPARSTARTSPLALHHAPGPVASDPLLTRFAHVPARLTTDDAMAARAAGAQGVRPSEAQTRQTARDPVRVPEGHVTRVTRTAAHIVTRSRRASACASAAQRSAGDRQSAGVRGVYVHSIYLKGHLVECIVLKA